MTRTKGTTTAWYIRYLNQNVCTIPTPDKLLDTIVFVFTEEQKEFILARKYRKRSLRYKDFVSRFNSTISRTQYNQAIVAWLNQMNKIKL